MISLKLNLKHVLQLRSGGSRVHRIDAHDSSRSPSNDPCDATRPEIKIKEEVFVPHRGKRCKSTVYKV